MKTVLKLAGIAGLLAVGACAESPREEKADQVEEAYDNKAEAIEAQADNAATDAMEDRLENKAAVVDEIGEQKAEAIEEGR